MKEELFKDIKIVAYFLWEYTKFENALKLWCCSEDIAYYLSYRDFTSFKKIKSVIESEKTYYDYVEFIRNIAYRIYLYTANKKSEENWYAAEKLFSNLECVYAITDAARIFKYEFPNSDMIKIIRSQHVKDCLKG